MEIKLKNLTKIFPGNPKKGIPDTRAVDNLDVVVPDGKLMQGPSICFFSKATPEQKLAAWLFYKFITNTNNSAIWSVLTGYNPVRTSSYQTTIYKDRADVDGAKGLVKKVADFLADSTNGYSNWYYTSPAFKGSSTARVEMGSLMGSVMTLYQFTAYDGIAVGDYVNVSGTVSPYSGLIELKPATVTKIAAADAPELVTPTTLAITATSTPTIVTNMASRWTSIADGLVTSVAGSDGANLTIKVKVGTAVYTVFENATYCAAADYATFKQTRSGATAASLIAVNDVISVEGWSSFYTDPQLVGAKITKWTEGVAPSDTPITIANLANVGWKADTSYSLQGFVTGYYSGIGTPKNGMSSIAFS